MSLRNDLADPIFDGAGFNGRVKAFLLAYAARTVFVFYCVLFLSYFLLVGIMGLGLLE